jgi:hypothetical protein
LPNPSLLKIEGSAGIIKFGLLAQPQYQALGSPSADGLAHDLYVRRMRFLVGGTLLKYIDFFWQVDTPNLFKSQPATVGMSTVTQKNNPSLAVVDAFATFKPAADLLKLDAGFFLPPLAHNYLQGVATLFAWDFFSNTYRASGVFGNAGTDPAGRDLGVQVRGLLLDGHLEYRAGLFQGLRNAPAAASPGVPAKVGGRNSPRLAARVQLNLLDADSGIYYGGAYFGAKQVVSVGTSYDFQDDYKYWAFDGVLDLPVGPGIASAQVNVVQWDGGSFIAALPKQTAFMAEAGYTIKALLLSPILRYEQRWIAGTATAAVSDEQRYVGGLAFWPFGHNSNIKAFYSHIHATPAIHDYDQVNVQWQVFFY